MKKLICSQSFRVLLALAFAAGAAKLAVAAEKKDARVTQVVKDVRVLVSKSGGRPASVNETVREGQAVRTGDESRAELTFTDQTLTRLGANTVFSFGPDAKEFDLASGAALLCVPKSAGAVRINTAAATAAVTGFTALTEYHPKGTYKFIVLEGDACIKLRSHPTDPCVQLHSGDMFVIPPGGKGNKGTVDVKKLIGTSKLIKGFDNKLPDWALKDILGVVGGQQGAPPPNGGYTDPTNQNAVDQAHADQTPPEPKSTPHGSPPGDLRHNNAPRQRP